MLGALNGTAVGLVVGSGLGYVLGGVLGRKTAATAELARTRLRDVSAEQLVAGALGLVGGVLLGAGVAWPVFFLPQAYLAFPLFGFVVVVLGYFGSQVGDEQARRRARAVRRARRARAPRRRRRRRCRASSTPRSRSTAGSSTSCAPASCTARCWCPTPGARPSCRASPTPATTCAAAKGRRGLEVLEALKREHGVDARGARPRRARACHEVDAKLVRICLDRGAALLTLDTNLAKAAALAGVRVLNLHALALALRPPVAAGDDVPVLLLKAGKEAGQAVGYLDDGSMVVVERGRGRRRPGGRGSGSPAS